MCDTPMLENDGIGREGTASDYTSGVVIVDGSSLLGRTLFYQRCTSSQGGLEYVGLAAGAMHSMQSIN